MYSHLSNESGPNCLAVDLCRLTTEEMQTLRRIYKESMKYGQYLDHPTNDMKRAVVQTILNTIINARRA